MRLTEGQRRELHSGEYVERVARLPIHRLTRLLPLMDLRPTDRLVDFACGAGTLLEVVHRRVRSYDGVDFCPDFIAAARSRADALGIVNAAFHCEEITSFCETRPEGFDVVTAFDFSEHLYDDDFLRVFAAARDVLRPGGSLHLYTPNLEFLWERLKDIGLVPQFPQHVGVRDHARHLALLELCGFERDRIERFDPPHFNVFRALHPLRHIPGIGRWFKAKLYYRCVK